MTEKEARKLIKRHIQRRGNESVELTPKLVRYWWNLLNVAVFKGTLNPAKRIKLFAYKNVHAWAIPEKKQQISLAIQPEFISRTLFLSILVHEMVHAWEYQTHNTIDHGKHFLSWAPKILSATTLILKQEIDENDFRH